MARKSKQDFGATLFDAFDYYDEKGELKNELFDGKPTGDFSRERDEQIPTASGTNISENQSGARSTKSSQPQRLQTNTRADRELAQPIQRGRDNANRQYGAVNLGDRDQRERNLFTESDIGGFANQSELGAQNNGFGQSSSIREVGGATQSASIQEHNANGQEFSSVANGGSGEMGEVLLSASNTPSQYQRANNISNEANNNGARNIHQSLFDDELRQSDTISDSSGYASEFVSAQNGVEQFRQQQSNGDIQAGRSELSESKQLDSENSNSEPLLVPESSVNFATSDLPNYKLTDDVSVSGIKSRIYANVAAIQILKSLGDKMPTDEQKAVLSKYSGWGGLGSVFVKDELKEQLLTLQNTLTQEEFTRIERSSSDAYYTPKFIIDSIYESLEHFGFNNDENQKDLYEPSLGVGRFIGYSPNENYRFHGVEIDNISSEIAKKLYPQAQIQNLGFQNTEFNRQFDAFIGNPPYGEKRLYSSKIGSAQVLDFFMLNAIENLKDDGVAAFVVSHNFLDKSSPKLREKIAQKATLLGAIRLPNSVFKSTNADVMSDLVFFQKGADRNKEWINAKVVDKQNGLKLNEYFVNHQNHILGDLGLANTNHGIEIYCKDKAGLDLRKEISKIISTLPKDVYKYHETEYKFKHYLINPDSEKFAAISNYLSDKKKGNLVEIDGEIYKIANEAKTKLEYVDVKDAQKERLKGFIAIRDNFNELIKLEQKNIADDDMDLIVQREKLNRAYDKFVKNFGYLSKSTNKSLFSQDVESNKITALEKQYDKGISKAEAIKNNVPERKPSAKKADIFTERTIRPAKEIEVKTPKEALMASLMLQGKINVDFMQEHLQNMSQEQILQDLQDQRLIFENHNKKGEYLTADEYLSGNVKKKYREVKDIVENGDESLRRNLDSLSEVLPKDLKATDISVSFGTTWIPAQYYEQFIMQEFEAKGVNVKYNNHTGWKARVEDASYEKDLQYSFRQDGHRVSPNDILQYAFDRTAMILKKPSGEFDKYDKPIMQTDYEATALVNEKIDNLKQAFNEWIYKDLERREHLEQIYNDTFNTNVVRKYDGSHLELPGFSSSKKLYPHQKDAIWASIQNKSILLDHQVGAGKTLSTICSLMEQKRMGLIKKPLVIVPNHIIEQWNKDFYDAYPTANVLVAQKEDLTPDKREEFYAKIASNNWDCVIMTHSQLAKIPMPYDFYNEYLNDEIELLRELRADMIRDGENERSRIIKDFDNEITKLETMIEKNIENKTKSIDFSELGVDSIVIDEAHEFKNLGVRTKMRNVLGLGSQTPSQKAQNLYVLTKYLHENDYRMMFLTGTPVSNSITELYTIQRYLQPQMLQERRIYTFDSWASTFGDTSIDFELDSSGVNYKLVTRFAKFNNVSELSEMYRTNAHIISNKDILELNPNFVPKLYNDKPINVVSERSNEIAEFIGIQDDRMNWNEGSIVWRMENFAKDPARNNVLACTTDARKAGLDFRLINPNADDYSESKSSKLAQNIYDEYKLWDSDKGTQLVFCDLSTPKINSQKVRFDMSEEEIQAIQKAESANLNDVIDGEVDTESNTLSADEVLAQSAKFDVYSDILKKLVKLGIPQNEIAFIHDAKTNIQKQALFDKVNRGDVRVLIGSRQKMGAGTNVQERIVGVHHLDCPWRPSDLEQANGRAIRQGNALHAKYGDDFRIKEWRYAIQATYDARMWQVIESKARGIEQFRNADKNTRKLDDITMGSASAAEMKAQATGNPLMLLQIQLANELKKENAKESAFKKELYSNEETLARNVGIRPNLESELQILNNVKQILESNPKTENFTCESFVDGAYKTFEIKKESEQKDKETQENQVQKELEASFWKNLKSALDTGEETKFFKYRGLTINGLVDNNYRNFSFSISDESGKYIEPDNLNFARNTQSLIDGNFENVIKFNGLWTRINNFCKDIDKNIETQQNKIALNAEMIATLSERVKNKTYPDSEYLEALRKDNSEVIKEIQKMSKEKGYQSNFTPKSEAIKQRMQSNKSAELER